MAESVDHQSIHQEIPGSIPGQGTCPGCGLIPGGGMQERDNR